MKDFRMSSRPVGLKFNYQDVSYCRSDAGNITIAAEGRCEVETEAEFVLIPLCIQGTCTVLGVIKEHLRLETAV